jgi:HTH-type transcriptional regulator, sugar sensing transcriptional regulator
LSQERVLKTLIDFGLSPLDAKVYVFLGKRGLQKGQDIAKALKVHKQQIYRSLKNLQNKGIVSVTLDHPARYSAEPFQKVIDLFIREKVEETQRLKQSKGSILSDWHSIAIDESEDTSQKFTVIKGKNIIYSKIKQMIQVTKKCLFTMTSVPNLVRADQFGFLDTVVSLPIKESVELRFLTELSEKNIHAVKGLLKKIPEKQSNFKIRVPDLSLKLFSRMIIRDEDEVIFFINTETDTAAAEQDDLGLWTNCKSIVNAFAGVFEELWRNSTDIQKRITQMETGNCPLQTSFIQDTETTNEKHVNTLLLAKKEIIMITSSENLISFWKNKTFSQKWLERSVCVKIMAPITTKNFEYSKQLSQFIKIRHVSPSYIETTIVDGKHLFEFKEPYLFEEKPREKSGFRDTFYTDDIEQVEKMLNTINNIWKNALPLSSVTQESVKPYGLMPPPLSNNHWRVVKNVLVSEEKIEKREKDVLNKIISSHKTLDGEKLMYATAALAIVHPPDNFNLPDLMFQINQVEKQSIFGRGDSLLIYLWLDTPEGYFFAPSGGLGDNPEGVTLRREIFFTENPAKQSYRQVQKDELQIRVYGNSLFCGWTVPIQLYPSKYVLPPACLLVEGYGKVKTKAFSISLPSGFESAMEYNYFDAFVTFMHPKSKYSGPGTDGAFIRDLVTTNKSPQK